MEFIRYVTLHFRAEISAAELHSDTEIAPKSGFVCVSRDFRALARAIQCSVNLALFSFVLFLVRYHPLHFQRSGGAARGA